MGSLDQEQPAGRRVSIVLSILLTLGIFSTFYFTSLSGFSRLDLRDSHLTIQYSLPERTVVLPFIEVLNVQEESAFKGRWRLVLITDTSGVYESTLASQADVHRAGEFLKHQMVQPYSLH